MYYIPGVKKLPDFYVNRAEKSHKKFLKKSLKKVLTLRNQSSIINKLSQNTALMHLDYRVIKQACFAVLKTLRVLCL